MRGDQLARQWRIIRAIEASPNWLSVPEIAQRGETRIRTIYRDLEALQAAGVFLHAQRVQRASRWAFIGTCKFKTTPPFTLTELMSPYFYRALDCKALGQALPRYPVGCRAVELKRESRTI